MRNQTIKQISTFKLSLFGIIAFTLICHLDSIALSQNWKKMKSKLVISLRTTRIGNNLTKQAKQINEANFLISCKSPEDKNILPQIEMISKSAFRFLQLKPIYIDSGFTAFPSIELKFKLKSFSPQYESEIRFSSTLKDFQEGSNERKVQVESEFLLLDMHKVYFLAASLSLLLNVF